MKWFSGEVLEAITSAKSQNAIFVVFVMGPSEEEATVNLNEILEDEETSKMFDDMVCIKVENGTTACNQFSQIYPVIIVPSVFFIDSATGVDLEITAVVSTESLAASVKKAVAKNADVVAAPLISAPSTQIPPLETMSNPPPADSTPSTSASTSEDTIQSRVDNARSLLNDQIPIQPGSVASHDTPTSLDDRVSRAKRLMGERQMTKQMEEEDKEKNKEMERREQEKLMREAMGTREEQEAMKAAKERKKERSDDKAAMEAVKAQIKQDREERKAKYDAEKEADALKRKEQERKFLVEKAAQAEKAVIERSQTARLQFRLPDGRHQTKQFPADSPLSAVYDWIATDLETGFHGGFTLSTTFPRRNLDTQDKAATLKQLEMAPSSTVLVMPLGGGGGGSLLPAGGIMSLLNLLMTPFTVLWAMISNLLGMGPAPEASGTTGQERKRTSGEAPNTSYGKRSATGVRQDGNVRRLGNPDDEDDENNTWNGNSTQQM